MTLTGNLRGIVALCAATACFVFNDAMVKLAAERLPTGEIITVRGLVTLSILVVAVMVTGQFRHLPRLKQRAVIARSILEPVVAVIYITALAHVPLAELTAIALTTPLMMTAASVVILRERVGWRRWSAVLVGFAGMLLVVKPSPSGIDFYAFLGVLTCVGVTTRDLITRRIDPATPSLIISFATSLAVLALGLAISLGETWFWPTGLEFLWLAIAAVGVAIANIFIVMAFRGVEVSVVSPFRYSAMVWALALGIGIWGVLPDRWSMAGIALIVGAGLYVLHRERLRAS